jgi:hypothetical protein
MEGHQFDDYPEPCEDNTNQRNTVLLVGTRLLPAMSFPQPSIKRVPSLLHCFGVISYRNKHTTDAETEEDVIPYTMK